MSNPSFDISKWCAEHDLDYRTPELAFDSCKATDWNPSLRYDESPPTCIHYSIEWKMLLKKGRLSKLTSDTEQNLVLAPGAFWDQTLKPKLQQLLAKKTPRNKCYEPDETNVVEVVEDQLMAWSHLLREGRRLRTTFRSFTRRPHNRLPTHGDVPPWIREVIYAKEQQDLEHRKRKRQGSFSESSPPIHITNVIPTCCNQDLVSWSTGLTPETRDNSYICHAPKLKIPRLIDKSMHCYCEWLCVGVSGVAWKNGYREACKIALEEGLDLEWLYLAQDVEARSLAEKGVKRGIAIKFVSKVKAWLEEM
ncbi:hypothetical protein B0T25DRAFT_621611 [Lasiosphaeria hispida]|uniref:Uncharacterized protein n=1 Tax=Lasiosphaeria hispida TaxID=260671 RepID=A0AAJ0MIX3_9PEZI|nr:hypothetical protein B0T25DRAFT_621611 [Lasiosphaeria hispida]